MTLLANEKVRVRILGKEYEIDPGGLTPLEASHLAGYVDQKMREISDKLRLVDTQKIAVLAALNIAYELTARRHAEGAALRPDDEGKIKDMLSLLAKSLR